MPHLLFPKPGIYYCNWQFNPHMWFVNRIDAVTATEVTGELLFSSSDNTTPGSIRLISPLGDKSICIYLSDTFENLDFDYFKTNNPHLFI